MMTASDLGFAILGLVALAAVAIYVALVKHGDRMRERARRAMARALVRDGSLSPNEAGVLLGLRDEVVGEDDAGVTVKRFIRQGNDLNGDTGL